MGESNLAMKHILGRSISYPVLKSISSPVYNRHHGCTSESMLINCVVCYLNDISYGRLQLSSYSDILQFDLLFVYLVAGLHLSKNSYKSEKVLTIFLYTVNYKTTKLGLNNISRQTRNI